MISKLNAFLDNTFLQTDRSKAVFLVTVHSAFLIDNKPKLYINKQGSYQPKKIVINAIVLFVGLLNYNLRSIMS